MKLNAAEKYHFLILLLKSLFPNAIFDDSKEITGVYGKLSGVKVSFKAALINLFEQNAQPYEITGTVQQGLYYKSNHQVLDTGNYDIAADAIKELMNKDFENNMNACPGPYSIEDLVLIFNQWVELETPITVQDVEDHSLEKEHQFLKAKGWRLTQRYNDNNTLGLEWTWRTSISK